MLCQGILERFESAHCNSIHVKMSGQDNSLACFDIKVCVSVATMPLSVILAGHQRLQKSRMSPLQRLKRDRALRNRPSLIERLGLDDFHIY